MTTIGLTIMPRIPDEIQIDEYDITAAPNDFNILTHLQLFGSRVCSHTPDFRRN